MDLQTWVACLQQDHIDIVPQCSTLYNCGLTVFDAPRGRIKQVSVLDQLDPTTGQESATASLSYCDPIQYAQVDPCHVRNYLHHSRHRGFCLSARSFFALPTDEGVPAGLPLLPLGYHYPQTSTDRPWGRSHHGVWAIERGKLYLAPWIQSTESVEVKWDGLKRTWSDSDGVDPDPVLAQAVEEYVRWHHASKWDRDEAEANRAMAAYNNARQMLIHECREETRRRSACDPSLARASSVALNALYYNNEQKAQASCPGGQTGSPVSVTIPSGTVGSNISVDDANQKALAQAQAQAQAQLVCTGVAATYWNSIAYTAQSSGCSQIDPNATVPTGTISSATVAIGTVSSTVSIADANAKAQQKAQDDANAAQVCTYSNSPQSVTQSCPDGSHPAVGTVAAGQYTAQSVGTSQQASAQSNANAQAAAEAKNLAVAAFAGTDCGSGPATIYWNTANPQAGFASGTFFNPLSGQTGLVQVTVIMPAHLFSNVSQGAANLAAEAAAQSLASNEVQLHIALRQAGSFTITYPGP